MSATILDCGCYIREGGGRVWCPTCADGGPRGNAETPQAAQQREASVNDAAFIEDFVAQCAGAVDNAEPTTGLRTEEAERFLAIAERLRSSAGLTPAGQGVSSEDKNDG